MSLEITVRAARLLVAAGVGPSGTERRLIAIDEQHGQVVIMAIAEEACAEVAAALTAPLVETADLTDLARLNGDNT